MTPIRQQVLAVYAEADAAVAAAAPRCDASGRCCRFTEYGHTLFISHFEAEILLETAPPYPQPVSRDGCPFQVNGLCTARESRPLGCRIYFCDPTFAERMVEITEAAIAKLKAIANEHDTGWNYAPLHHFLNAARRSPPLPQTDSINTTDTRFSLPLLHPTGD
ncbi:MAG: hypothetical protein U0792_05170 [Gemmataceae bacterium]